MIHILSSNETLTRSIIHVLVHQGVHFEGKEGEAKIHIVNVKKMKKSVKLIKNV